jgi:hypothetical protein
MDLHELPFAKIIVLRDDIAEVMINDGVRMNQEMVEQYHDFLLSHLRAPFSLLINKINSYTYDFHAQEKLATLKEINSMAVVAYNRVTKITTETLASYPRDVKWNLRIFSNRDDALTWLLSEQGATGNDHTQSEVVLKSNSPTEEEIC